jgi:branched-chain amino acid transport system ATP-binding protein
VSTPLLEVDHLEVFYGEARALSDVSFTMHEGEIVSVIGANGAGKTTLICSIVGILPFASGAARFKGQDLSKLTTAEICELGLAQVPEGRQVFPTMSVLENLEMGAIPRRARGDLRRNLERVFALYPRLGERRRQDAGTLSGGEQQMLAIARCLMSNPECILFDEPSLGLAPAIVDKVFDNILLLNKQGISVVLVEQNVADSLTLCNRAVVIENGATVLSGSGRDLLRDDRVRRAYLGL